MQSAEKVDTYDIYNVCYGKGYTVMEVLELIKEIEGNDNPIEFVNNKSSNDSYEIVIK